MSLETRMDHGRPAWPWGLIGMLVVVSTFEMAVARRDRFSTDLAANWAHKGRAAVAEATKADLVCFGDSMIGFGLIPRALVGPSDETAYNLALHDGSPAASYLLLRRLLGAGGRPTAVVVDFMPQQLARGPTHPESRRHWPELAGLGETIDLARSTGDPSFVLANLAAQGLASYKARHEIRACVRAALEGRGWSAKRAVRLLRRNWDANLGAQVMPPFVEAHPRDEGRRLFVEDWTPDPSTLDYVRRFLRLAESRGIAVYWLVPPIRPAGPAGWVPPGLEEPYVAIINAIRAEFPALTIVDGRHARYDPSLFADAVHLNRRGALTLSSGLAAIVNRAEIEAPGWVTLSDSTERPMEARVEDMDESRLALAAGRRPRS